MKDEDLSSRLRGSWHGDCLGPIAATMIAILVIPAHAFIPRLTREAFESSQRRMGKRGQGDIGQAHQSLPQARTAQGRAIGALPGIARPFSIINDLASIQALHGQSLRYYSSTVLYRPWGEGGVGFRGG